MPLAGLGSLLLFWWVGTAWLGEPGPLRQAFSPDRCLAELAKLLSSGALLPHILASLKRVLVSLLFAVLVGVPVGILVGVSSRWDRATSMVFQFVRMISPLSWMPVAIMLFGIGDAPVYFLLTVAAVWPILLNTSAGVASVEERWILLARSMSATRWETVLTVVAPAILAHVLTGIRLAIGIIWIVLVPAEMLGVSSGLGYYILDTRDRLAYSELVAVILLVGVIGYVLDLSARRIHQAWIHRPVD
ncbi:ABC transporter permease [Nitrospira sp. KM1]|nr:ABC transporter permease [Nitrospira sp. KM1]